MKKSDLKTGMVVEFGGGRLGLVIGNSINDLRLAGDWGGKDLGGFDEDLIDTFKNSNNWTITKIFAEMKHGEGSGFIFKMRDPSYFTRDLLWERPKHIEELTLEQVCKELGRDIKIVK